MGTSKHKGGIQIFTTTHNTGTTRSLCFVSENLYALEIICLDNENGR